MLPRVFLVSRVRAARRLLIHRQLATNTSGPRITPKVKQRLQISRQRYLEMKEKTLSSDVSCTKHNHPSTRNVFLIIVKVAPRELKKIGQELHRLRPLIEFADAYEEREQVGENQTKKMLDCAYIGANG